MILPVTEDQALFLDVSRQFLDRTSSIDDVRRAADLDDGFSRAWWTQAAELGWAGLAVPEELGGGSVSGTPIFDLVHLAEEIGRRAAPGPLVATSAALYGIARSPGAASRGDEIDAFVSGKAVLSWADAPPSRDAPVLERSGDRFTLSGGVDVVEAALQADQLLVTAGRSQVLVHSDHPGVTIERRHSIDLSRRVASVRFSAVDLGPEHMVGQFDQADAQIGDQRLLAALLASAEATGAAERVFDFTTEYAATRRSFGRPLASYQALKHRFADMKTWLEGARGIVQGAAEALQSGGPDAARRVSAAKAWTGETLPAMTQDCVQMHGGIGVTWEHDLHIFLRRQTFVRAIHGTPSDHRRSLAATAITAA